jgi:purine nucleosidase
MPLVVDTDGASDDAAALLMAAASPELVAVTVTAGVVDVDQAVHNTLVTLDVAGRGDVPVYRGAPRSLLGRAFPGAEEVHGVGGLGGHVFSAVGSAARGDATDALDRLLVGPDVTLVTLGPMTNLATLLARGKDVGARVVAMAGSQDAVGNVTAVAEYNVWCDPEAAAAVLGSGTDVTLVGWDVSRRDAVIGDRERALIAAAGTTRSSFLLRVNEALDRFCREVQGLEGYDLPDAAAVAVALDPSIVTRMQRLPVSVETGGRRTRGMTVVDHRPGVAGTSMSTVVWSIDHERFVAMLVKSLG